MLASAFERVLREERGRVLASLLRVTGRFDLAEDALQDAATKALEVWGSRGVPANPAAWLTTVARRRAIDLMRRSRARQQHEAVLDIDEAPNEIASYPDDTDEGGDDVIEDERLRLLFTCCHPALSRSAQVALALRTLCGLTTAEIARAHLEPESTAAQRIVRAKQKIDEAGVPFEVPGPAAFPERVAAVLEVVYFVYNEGYRASSGPSFDRSLLAAEAIRLGRLVVTLLPEEPEPKGLLALMLFHDARRGSRLDAEGALVPLEEQDRSIWDRAQIAEGNEVLDAALARRSPGPYQVQAAIAALHAAAPTAADTDWKQISLLYRSLLRACPTDVVLLNAAAALAMATTPERGLALLRKIEARGALESYYLLRAAKGDLLRRLGDLERARVELRAALALTTNPGEQKYLERRLRELDSKATARIDPPPSSGR